jgi:RNA-directed DNA polymerase
VGVLQKWLKVGLPEDGVVTTSERGTGQGSVALLAKVYLHYVFDLWAERWRRCEASGDMIIVRQCASAWLRATTIVTTRS